MLVTPNVHPAATIAADKPQPITAHKTHSAGRLLYYRDVLTRLPAILPGASEEELLALLPHRWHPA